MGIDLSDFQVQNLLQYIYLLEKWNKTYNLTAIRDPVTMVQKHLLDSLSILEYINEKAVLDVGSGAGLPGVPLAIMLSDVNFSLLDSNSKKTRFVHQVAAELSLKNINIENKRVESWYPQQRFNIILSRAFSSIVDMIDKTRHLITDHGKWYAMKGDKVHNEVALLNNVNKNVKVVDVFNLNTPKSVGKRHLVVIKPL